MPSASVTQDQVCKKSRQNLAGNRAVSLKLLVWQILLRNGHVNGNKRLDACCRDVTSIRLSRHWTVKMFA